MAPPAEPQPELLERILALRPTSAAHRLGNSPLPLLNPRDLARALDDAAMPLLCVPVVTAEALPGLLRAARDQDAALGLAAPYRPGSRDDAQVFLDALVAAADDARHLRPVFLQAGPLRIASADPRGLQERAEAVYRFVDAGFSLISVDASTLPPEAGVEVVADLVGPAAERELAVEIAAPVDGPGRASPAALQTALEGFHSKKLDVRFVRVRSPQFLPESLRGGDVSLELPALRDLDEVARSFGAWLAVEVGSARSLGAWAEGGVRKVDLGAPFTEIAAGALERSVRDSLRVKAAAVGIPLWELLAQLGDPLAESSPEARLRVEALSYAEALEALERCGGRGSGSAAMAFLAEQAGY